MPNSYVRSTYKPRELDDALTAVRVVIETTPRSPEAVLLKLLSAGYRIVKVGKQE